MASNEKINGFQFFVLVFTFTIGNTILNSPSLVVIQAKHNAWISSILAFGFGILLVFIYSSLGEKFPQKTIVQITEILLGKALGKIVSFLLFCYFFIISSITLKQLSDFLTSLILPETPMLAIHILLVAIIIMGCYLGIETLARAGEILFPFIFIILLLLFLFVLPGAEFRNVKPILDDMKSIMKGTIIFTSIPFLQLIVFLMIFPFIDNKRKGKQSFFLGVSIAGIFLVCAILFSILVLGPVLTENVQYPIYYLASKISIAEIIQKLEVIMAVIWFITIFFKISILFFASNLGIVQIFNTSHSRPFLFPLGLLLILLTQIITPDIIYFDLFIEEIIPPYSLTFGFILPVLLLTVYYFRKKTLSQVSIKS